MMSCYMLLPCMVRAKKFKLRRQMNFLDDIVFTRHELDVVNYNAIYMCVVRGW
jgi:hypothetical protein